MGYDLRPVNKELKELAYGAFTWPFMLQETGMGYVLGYGEGRTPASYVYQKGNKGAPVSNDGYKVNATEAKAMAMVARGYVSVQRFVNKEWEAIPETERKRSADQVSSNGNSLYRGEVHEDRLKQLEEFADFAEQSKGFTIH